MEGARKVRENKTLANEVVKFHIVIEEWGAPRWVEGASLSAHESEEGKHGEGVGVYATLLQSDIL